MITDPVPRRAERKREYECSDRLLKVPLPPAQALAAHCRNLEKALADESLKSVQSAADALAAAVAGAFQSPCPAVKVLGVRPRRVTESSVHELFGDYDPQTARIRLWMRTPVRRQPTSFGTLLSTLCHELCHHFDVVSLGLPNTFHTRGFYERAGLLYHHIRRTPPRRLVWVRLAAGRFHINWAETMRGNEG